MLTSVKKRCSCWCKRIWQKSH